MAYPQWLSNGSPITPAQPVRDLVAALKAAYPRGSSFGWAANDAHYQAIPPGDHTPYSADAWPDPDPQWWVFATDVMVVDVGGVFEADRLFRYWLGEGKAGRAPWIKYLIWQATIYDVRNGWEPQPNSGHYDHIHVSVRTDHQHTHLGAWQVLPPGDDMTPQQEYVLHVINYRVDALVSGRATVSVPAFTSTTGVKFPAITQTNATATAVAAIAAKVDIDPAELAAITAAARTGALESADAIAAAVAAHLPDGVLTKADVQEAVRKVFADAATPDG